MENPSGGSASFSSLTPLVDPNGVQSHPNAATILPSASSLAYHLAAQQHGNMVNADAMLSPNSSLSYPYAQSGTNYPGHSPGSMYHPSTYSSHLSHQSAGTNMYNNAAFAFYQHQQQFPHSDSSTFFSPGSFDAMDPAKSAAAAAAAQFPGMGHHVSPEDYSAALVLNQMTMLAPMTSAGPLPNSGNGVYDTTSTTFPMHPETNGYPHQLAQKLLTTRITPPLQQQQHSHGSNTNGNHGGRHADTKGNGSLPSIRSWHPMGSNLPMDPRLNYASSIPDDQQGGSSTKAPKRRRAPQRKPVKDSQYIASQGSATTKHSNSAGMSKNNNNNNLNSSCDATEQPGNNNYNNGESNDEDDEDSNNQNNSSDQELLNVVDDAGGQQQVQHPALVPIKMGSPVDNNEQESKAIPFDPTELMWSHNLSECLQECQSMGLSENSLRQSLILKLTELKKCQTWHHQNTQQQQQPTGEGGGGGADANMIRQCEKEIKRYSDEVLALYRELSNKRSGIIQKLRESVTELTRLRHEYLIPKLVNWRYRQKEAMIGVPARDTERTLDLLQQHFEWLADQALKTRIEARTLLDHLTNPAVQDNGIALMAQHLKRILEDLTTYLQALVL